jgi:hypothetical protein
MLAFSFVLHYGTEMTPRKRSLTTTSTFKEFFSYSLNVAIVFIHLPAERSLDTDTIVGIGDEFHTAFDKRPEEQCRQVEGKLGGSGVMEITVSEYGFSGTV